MKSKLGCQILLDAMKFHEILLSLGKYCKILSIFGACIIKRITAVIYGFRNKLECLSLNNRLGWKGLLGTNTLAYYKTRKLRP